MSRKYLKDFLTLAGVIIIAAIGARILAGGETLDEYAKKNPQNPQVSSMQTTAEDASQNEEIRSSSKEGKTEAPVNDGDGITNPDTSVTSNINSDQKADTPDVVAKDSELEQVTGSDTSDVATDGESGTPSSERVTYMDGFYYEPISNDVFKRISGISYPVDCTVPLEDLNYVGLKYIDFDGESRNGELICNKALAQDMVEIFYELYQAGYQLESVRLIDEFGGDDTDSMLANNTSCFNYRVVEGTTRLSNHAYGRAIDINPFYNPYITYSKDGTTHISPEGSEAYADRSASFPYKIDENDLAYKLFTEHGFKWGGNWNSSKDYQHFEKK